MAVSFSCPGCKKMLRTSNSIPAGKKVKCPSCGAVFAPAVVEEASTAITSRPMAKVPMRRSADVEDEDDLPRARRRPIADDDGEDDRPRQRPIRSEDEESDEDERPRRRRRRDEENVDDDRPRKKKRKKKAGSKLSLILTLSGVGAIAVVFAITAWVWPGFLIAGGGAGGKGGAGGAAAPGAVGLDALFAYAPADADVVLGVSLVSMRTKAEFMDGFNAGMQQQGLNQAQSNAFKQMEQALLYVLPGRQPTMVGVVSFAAPQDEEQMRVAMSAGAGKNVQGKTLYPLRGNIDQFMAMPTNKIMVVAYGLPEADLANLLEGKGRLRADLATFAKASGSKFLWGMIDIQGRMKQELAGLNPKDNKQIPSLAAALPAIERSKNATFEIDFAPDFKSVQAKVVMTCANDADAGQVETLAKEFWTNQVMGFFKMFAMMPQAQGAALAAMKDDLTKTFKTQKQGARVTVTAQLTQTTMEAFARAGGKQAGIPGGAKGKGGPRFK